MKYNGLLWSPFAQLRITKSEVQDLIKLSAMHYSEECRAAGRKGGMLYGFNERFVQHVEEIVVSVPFDGVDLLTKIAEIGGPVAIVLELRKVMKIMSDISNERVS